MGLVTGSRAHTFPTCSQWVAVRIFHAGQVNQLFRIDIFQIWNSNSKNSNLPMTKDVYSLAWYMDGNHKPQSK